MASSNSSSPSRQTKSHEPFCTQVQSQISDYALVGNLRCAALISRDGAIDWFCPLRFDSPACFAALLGTPEHGRWLIAPATKIKRIDRAYQKNTLVLETRYHTDTGVICVSDFMPLFGCCLARIVRCEKGSQKVNFECTPRFNYGQHRPSLRHANANKTHLVFGHGDEELILHSETDFSCASLQEGKISLQLELQAGEAHWFTLMHNHCDQAGPDLIDAFKAEKECAQWWLDWVAQCNYDGRWRDQVIRSLITLKALTYEPSGAMVAAPTTSLPEFAGGSGNWDYRFCWLRDATLALDVFLSCNYKKEACAWRDWLEDAMRGHDGPLKPLYTLDGKVPGPEQTLDWLPGYQGARPVRIGNAASDQHQLDLRGELMDVLHVCRASGLAVQSGMWELQCDILDHLEKTWRDPDVGFWEFRGPPRQLTLSKVMAWVAFDRSIIDSERYKLNGPVDKWRELRDTIRADILQHGVHPEGGYFVEQYDSDILDASLLMVPLVEFLPASDERVIKTVAAIERELCYDGLIYRYHSEHHEFDTNKTGREGAFLLCSFWMVDNYILAGRIKEAQELFERLLSLCNDVCLLAEEYDPRTKAFLGNFPQSLTHLGLINSARLMSSHAEIHRRG